MLFAFRYRYNEAGTDGLMKNNAMHVFFNNKEFHKMMKLIKIKIIIFLTVYAYKKF
jgi:hypothetical protein